MKSIPKRAISGILAQPWAIQPEWLTTIIEIARREGDVAEALAKRSATQLERADRAQQRGATAIIPILGPIFPRANLITEFSGATSLETLSRDLQVAIENQDISSIILDIDSPGGVAAGIDDMAEMIGAADKPITAFVGGVGASAAFWLSVAASEIVIARSAIVGSIGVVMGTQVQEHPDRDGFRDIEIVSSNAENKRPDPTSEEGLAEIRQILDAIESNFVEDVARFRGVSVETVLSDFGRGGVSVGAAAVAAGMADRIGTFEGVLADLAAGATGGRTGRSFPTSNRSNPAMAIKTAADLAAQHPELVNEIRASAHADGHKAGKAAGTTEGKAEGLDEGRKAGAEAAKAEGLIEGATAERARIAALKGAALPGFEAQLEECIADGKSTAADLAVKTVAAQKASGKTYLEGLKGDAEALDKGDGAPDPTTGDGADSKPGAKTGADAKALAREAQKRITAAKAEGRTLSPEAAIESIVKGEAA